MTEKLVRDRIPEGFPADDYRTAHPAEMMGLLLDKLDEEAAELRREPSIEELADVLEVIYHLAPALGSSITELETARTAKLARAGGFDDRTVWANAKEIDR